MCRIEYRIGRAWFERGGVEVPHSEYCVSRVLAIPNINVQRSTIEKDEQGSEKPFGGRLQNVIPRRGGRSESDCSDLIRVPE